MTLVYPKAFLTTGNTTNLVKVLTVIGRGIPDVTGGITTGKVDKDYLAIKTSASNVNLTEEEAYDLIDQIRSKLEINKDE